VVSLLRRTVSLALLVACAAASPAAAATFVVNTTADATPPAANGTCGGINSPCSLREAIQEANALNGLDRVEVPAGTYNLTATGATENANATGDLDVVEGVAIVGAGTRTTIVDGQALDRVFHVTAVAAFVSISGLTMRNGRHPVAETSVGGGGLANLGVETQLADVAIVGNANPDNGGGGIFEQGSAVVSADQRNLRLTRVLLVGNTARAGAGLYSLGRVAIENTTFSGNVASNPIGQQGGGAIENDGASASLALNATTFAGNQAPATFGSSINVVTPPQPPAVSNTLFADTSNGACNAALGSTGSNIERGATCGLAGTNDRVNTDPQLGPLADNGGATDTHLPARTSPAVDASTAPCPDRDQRGALRPFGPACDIGAAELVYAIASPQPAALTFDPATAERRPGDDNVVTASVRNGDGSAAPNRTVRYQVAGPNPTAGAATTDASGQARIAWDGVREGTDKLSGYVDVDSNLTADAGEPSAQASVVWSLPAPLQGRTMNLEPVSGVVRIRLPATAGRKGVGAAGVSRTAVLTEGRQVPIGTVVDVRSGRVQMSTLAGRRGSIQKGEFYGGVYQTTQSRSAARPYTEIRLTESLVCQSSRRGRLAPARARSRRLWGSAKGRYRTRGRHSTATVRGTVWLQKDTCATTTTVVREGTVIVTDFAKHRHVRVRAGRRYVARQQTSRRR
jgi:CSLREA domain-containing protein